MIELIPAIDIIDGKCVRLTQGDYSTGKVYSGDIAELAKKIEGYGFRRLHMVDLDGAKRGTVVNHRILEKVATQTSLTIDFGGGIRTSDDLQKAFDFGAAQVTVGSIAVKNPDTLHEWISGYGAERFILGADTENGHICTNGWADKSPVDLVSFIRTWTEAGVHSVLCTDITRDGTLQGPSTALYSRIMEQFAQAPIQLIASGGIGCMEDIDTLDRAGIPAVVFGKSIYEGKMDLGLLSSKYIQ